MAAITGFVDSSNLAIKLRVRGSCRLGRAELLDVGTGDERGGRRRDHHRGNRWIAHSRSTPSCRAFATSKGLSALPGGLVDGKIATSPSVFIAHRCHGFLSSQELRPAACRAADIPKVIEGPTLAPAPG
jgi:hypothetical protein